MAKGSALSSPRTTASSKRPSHPRDADPHHRAFMIRSLEKNDKELCVLQKLNQQLHKTRDAILTQCGDAVLLDLGLGKIVLDDVHEDELQESPSNPTDPAHVELCVSFLLHMKLRRKLLNRLSRRLNRVSHAMDGEDVSPPPPPKYGDLRLHLNFHAVEEYKQRVEQVREAKERIEQSQKKKEEEAVEKKMNKEELSEEANKEDGEGNTEQEQGGTEEQEDSKDVDAMETSPEKKEEEDTAMQDAEGEKDSDKQPETVSSTPTKAEEEELSTPDSLQHDYQIVKEFKDGYSKAKFANGDTRYLLLDQDVEEDYVTIKYSSGIGAAHRSMTFREKELDYRRWQHTLLAKIPEQPTFADLELDKRVFMQEERLNLLKRKDDATPKTKNKKQRVSGDSEEEDSEEEELEPMDMDEDSNKEDETEDNEEEETEEDSKDEDFTDEEEGVEKETDDSQDKGQEDNEDDSKEEKDDAGSKSSYDHLQKRKVMSLSAVPSFFEQDLRRTRLIHAELMAFSTQEHARNMIVQATNEYNATFRRSGSLYNQRIKVQTELNSLRYESRVVQSRRNNEYAVQVNVARARWQTQQDTLKTQKLVALMPCFSGRIAVGTPLTANASERTDLITSQVGMTMANLVDAVVTMQETGWKTPPVAPFVPPPPPPMPGPSVDPITGESMEKKRERREAALRRDVNNLAAKLKSSEEERKKAWKKLQKTRSEVGSSLQYAPGRKNRRSEPVLIQNTPMPNLLSSMPAVPPPPISISSSIPAYIPPFGKNQTPTFSTPTGSSAYAKYIAKVKERISADGTVAPVTPPKRLKDGSYQRPAGRTRKGMEWDAVRGIWVPK